MDRDMKLFRGLQRVTGKNVLDFGDDPNCVKSELV